MTRLILLLALVAVTVTSGELVNTNVDRTIDLTNQLVTVTTVQTIANMGSDAVSSIKLAHDSTLLGKLSHITVKSGDKKVQSTCTTAAVSIAAGASVTVKIVAVYARAQEAYPAAITQAETQLMRFRGNTYYSTPYATAKQTTTVKLAGAITSYTKIAPHSKADKKITLGPYTDRPADAEEAFEVHFENNAPFLAVTKLEREVEVSHWGNVAITENIDVLHTGAVLKGSFSRLDFQRIQTSGRSAVKAFTTRLPAAATDVYYRDLIGNISTSHMWAERDVVVFELRPRFPLFGGWKTFYTVGYNMPGFELLSRDGNQFRLTVRFVDHIFDHMVIDEAVVKVILPEGATNIRPKLPFKVDAEDNELRNTYLDTFGRPVIVFRKSKLVEEHMQEMEIEYEFSQSSLIREPLMIVGFLFALFTFFIVYNRIDFNIDTISEAGQRRIRLDRAKGKHSQLVDVYDRQREAFNQLRDAKKDEDRKAPLAAIRENAKEAESLTAELENVDADVAKKARDIARQLNDLVNDSKKTLQEDAFERIYDNLEKILQ